MAKKKIEVTSTGHYYEQLHKKFSNENKFMSSISFLHKNLNDLTSLEKQKIALKLHRQFLHPSCNWLKDRLKIVTFRPFQERHAIAHAHAHNTCAKVFRSAINWTCKSNFWLHFFLLHNCQCLIRYVSILVLILNRQLLLIIKLKLHS